METVNTNNVQSPQYTLLEPINNVKSIGSDDSSFSTYIQSSFNVILGVIIVIGVFRIMYGGTIFLTTDIVMGKMKGKETIINSLRGILLAMTTWSLLYFINPDILKNNVTKIVTDGVSGVVREVGGVVGGGEGSGGLGSRSCDSPAFIIEKINTNQNICSGQTCSKTCNFTPEILSIVKEESLKAGIDYRITLAIACRESSANPSAIGNHANNGYADCGLMQINMKGVGGGNTCTPAILDIHNNISEGIKQYKNKYNNISKSYNNVDKISQAFASYNCCANGDNPNDKSVSCDAGSGFTQSIPKWACPISPGNGSFNMCSVKNYACDVYTCINKY